MRAASASLVLSHRASCHTTHQEPINDNNVSKLLSRNQPVVPISVQLISSNFRYELSFMLLYLASNIIVIGSNPVGGGEAQGGEEGVRGEDEAAEDGDDQGGG